MATTAEASPPLEIPEGRIVVPGVDWDQYEQMLQIVGDRHIHVTYDAGMMEIRLPFNGTSRHLNSSASSSSRSRMRWRWITSLWV